MQFKILALYACVASAAFAQIQQVLCQARYATSITTCLLGVKECNPIEQFSACVCTNTGNKTLIGDCLKALLANPLFVGVPVTVAEVKPVTPVS